MFRYFETTADMGIIAEGETLEEAFSNAAKGLFNLMVNIENVEKKEKRTFEVSADDLCDLLYDFLTELLILHDSEFLVFSEFDVEMDKEGEIFHLKCIAFGEEFDKEKHEPKEEVKAITYHKMEIKHEGDKWVIKFIVDL
ncbi:archease [Methanotorris formicicus]|nr:archease [Methanotorris formicicus]